MSSLDHFREEPYRRILVAVRRSLEQNRLIPTGRIGLSNPTVEERHAVIGITGVTRDPGTKSISIDMVEFDKIVVRATGLTLKELLETLTGEALVDRKERSETKANALVQLRSTAEASHLHQRHTWFRQWIDSLGSQLTRLNNLQEPQRLAYAIRVLEIIDGRGPDDFPLLLSALAEDATGDTKALGRARPLATLILRALATRNEEAPPHNAEQVRDLWATANVVVDDLASRVLVLNVPAAGDGLGEWLTSAAKFGTPFQITLHQLVTLPITPLISKLFVCENPTVLRRASQELGTGCPPLVCTEGQPSVAFHYLIRRALLAGLTIYYHGDFDWPGIAMVNKLIERHNVLPWQMTSQHYDAGVREDRDHVALAGQEATATWDPDLSSRMKQTGAAIYEEASAITDGLIAELRGTSLRPPR